MNLFWPSTDPVIQLDILEHDECLTLSCTVRFANNRSQKLRIEQLLDLEHVLKVSDQLEGWVRAANSNGRQLDGGPEVLRRSGSLLAHMVFPPALLDLLRKLPGGFLQIGASDRLQPVPFELAYDGRSFLAERFAISRSVIGTTIEPPAKQGETNRRALVVGDPAGDLPEAYNEGIGVRDCLGELADLRVDFVSTRVTRDALLELLSSPYELLHYAGHIDPEGLRLVDGHLAFADIRKVLPSSGSWMVFLNGCSGADGARGLARDFLECGTTHVVAPRFDLPDQVGKEIALRAFSHWNRGCAISEGIRRARQEMGERRSDDTLWMDYWHLGDGTESVPWADPDPPARAVDILFIEEAIKGPAANDVADGAGYPSSALRGNGLTLADKTELAQRAIWRALLACLALLSVIVVLRSVDFTPEPPRDPNALESVPAVTALNGVPGPSHATRPLQASGVLVNEVGADHWLFDDQPISDAAQVAMEVNLDQSANLYLLRISGRELELLSAPPYARRGAGRHRVPETGVSARAESDLNTLVLIARNSPIEHPQDAVTFLSEMHALGGTVEPGETGETGDSETEDVPNANDSDRLWEHQRAVRMVCEYYRRHDARVATVRYRIGDELGFSPQTALE
ncbi:MAG: CHAT domain-containing protein [Myxococcales bacterium]|nr:CHAT domain-containing protein [Myxococcales bacterium]